MFSGVREHKEHEKEEEKRERGFWPGRGTLLSDEAQGFLKMKIKGKMENEKCGFSAGWLYK